VRGTDVDALCRQRGWSRTRLVHEMRTAARQQRLGELPAEDSLKRMIRMWANGSRGLSEFHAGLLTSVFGIPFAFGNQEPPPPAPLGDEGQAAEVRARVERSRASVDAGLVDLLELQTDGLRSLDRRLGAVQLLAQSSAHVEQITSLLRYSLPGGVRAQLAAAGAEAAALAGWQALDLGRPDDAWHLHEVARAAAQDSEDPAVLAHVTAQQAYVLLDLDRPDDAVALIRHARHRLNDDAPTTLRAWVWAAEAEALAAAGDEPGCRHALDQAAGLVEAGDGQTLPYLFLDAVHLARWRGHCLARLGSQEAIIDLRDSLDGLDPSFTRAEAGLHIDLALAYAQAGEQDVAQHEAERAAHLADATASERQRARIRRLRDAAGEPPHH
jgi:tetratricopeptide (TPR) repeat protein